MALPLVRLAPELARLAPSELIVSETHEGELRHLVSDFGLSLTGLARSAFDSTGAEARICNLFKIATLDAFGSFSRAEVSAMAR